MYIFLATENDETEFYEMSLCDHIFIVTIMHFILFVLNERLFINIFLFVYTFSISLILITVYSTHVVVSLLGVIKRNCSIFSNYSYHSLFDTHMWAKEKCARFYS
jgi:hypothetical protein